jgi:hypothetical protein
VPSLTAAFGRASVAQQAVATTRRRTSGPNGGLTARDRGLRAASGPQSGGEPRRDAEICPHCRIRSTPWRFHEGRWWFRTSDDNGWQWLDERTGSWVVHEPANAPAETA